MYPGYMTLGAQDPYGNPQDFVEIVNNQRTYAYAEAAGLCWLYECDSCDPASATLPGFPYFGVVEDPAPWFDPENPDSVGFFGVVGLDVSGDDSSTRQASVSMGLSGIGVIGPTYMAPRTMVVRALAVAEDECSLQFGLAWLRSEYGSQHSACGGDALRFFDCCPCLCEDPGNLNPDCWPTTYHELRVGPSCLLESWWARTYDEERDGPPDGVPPWWPTTYDEEDAGPPPGTENPAGVPMWWYRTYAEEVDMPPGTPYWPDTYGDLVVGPDPDDPTWCPWADIYRELRDGPPDWSCCVESCVVPYMRQFHNVRVTEGPIVLSSPVLHSRGAVAEIEFTIVAGDPKIYGEIVRASGTFVTGGTPITDVAPRTVRANPYRPARPLPEFVPQSWVREELHIPRVKEQVLTGVEPRVRVRASKRTGPVRLGLWAGDTRLAGYTIPFVAQNSALILSGGDAYYLSPNGYEQVSAFVRDWDGKWPEALDLPHGEYRLTIDQRPDDAVKLFVDVALAPVGAG